MTPQVQEDGRRKRRSLMTYLFGGYSMPPAANPRAVYKSRSPVVFRPVIYEPSEPASEATKSSPTEDRQSPIPISPKASSPSPEEVPRSPVPVAVVEQPTPSEATELVHLQTMSSSRSSRIPKQPLRGCRAPPSSPLPEVSPRSPVLPPLSPIGTECSSPSTPKPASNAQIPWEDYEVPDELGIARKEIPQEIRNIVLESLNERRAMRVSRLNQEVIVTTREIQRSSVDQVNDEQEIHEISPTASTHKSGSEDRRSESTQSVSSNTTVDSENEDGFLRPPSVKFSLSQPTSPKPAALSPQMEQVEFLLQQSKARTTKSRKLFKILPTSRRSQGRPNTPEDAHQVQPSTNAECIGCFDDISTGPAVTGLPCNHKYCPFCFTHLILTSSHTESTFPPNCCLLEIPSTVIRSHLCQQDLAVYDQRALEYAVPMANRFYCPRPSCATWINTRLAKRTNGGFTCLSCQHDMCSVCRGPSHPRNEDCPQDYGLNSPLEQAELAGWQRCHKCRTLVERTPGCRHIICRCGGEFCYTCGKPWHTCACTDADQARLDNERAIWASEREADMRRGEEDVRAAIAAVTRAEQHLAEERAVEEREAAEEAANLARREEERVARIKRHFSSLRQVLETVKATQRAAIEARHSASQEMITQLEQHCARTVATREREIRDEATFLLTEGTRMLDVLQRKHAHAMIETIARHRAHQDALRCLDLSDHVSRNPYHVAQQCDALKMTMLEALLPTQELERAELKAQQAREIKKWKGRTERTVRDHGAEGLCARVRRAEKEKIRGMVEEGRRRRGADWMWFEVMFEERRKMLGEEERRVLRCGGDVPEQLVLLSADPGGVVGLGGVRSGEMEGKGDGKGEVGGGLNNGGGGNGGNSVGAGDLNEYVRLRGWSGTPNFGLGMQMDGERGIGLGMQLDGGSGIGLGMQMQAEESGIGLAV